jgi:hypothetical protein
MGSINMPVTALTILFLIKSCNLWSRWTHLGSRWIWSLINCFTSVLLIRISNVGIDLKSFSISKIKREIIINRKLISRYRSRNLIKNWLRILSRSEYSSKTSIIMYTLEKLLNAIYSAAKISSSDNLILRRAWYL